MGYAKIYFLIKRIECIFFIFTPVSKISLYLPFAFFNLISPIMSILISTSEKRMDKIEN